MTDQDKIEKFLKENKLKFDGTGSSLNSDCVIIAGYADYIGAGVDVVLAAIQIVNPDIDRTDYAKELRRVYEFAYKYNYGNWWKTSVATKMYKF